MAIPNATETESEREKDRERVRKRWKKKFKNYSGKVIDNKMKCHPYGSPEAKTYLRKYFL